MDRLLVTIYYSALVYYLRYDQYLCTFHMNSRTKSIRPSYSGDDDSDGDDSNGDDNSDDGHDGEDDTNRICSSELLIMYKCYYTSRYYIFSIAAIIRMLIFMNHF